MDGQIERINILVVMLVLFQEFTKILGACWNLAHSNFDKDRFIHHIQYKKIELGICHIKEHVIPEINIIDLIIKISKLL